MNENVQKLPFLGKPVWFSSSFSIEFAKAFDYTSNEHDVKCELLFIIFLIQWKIVLISADFPDVDSCSLKIKHSSRMEEPFWN